MTPLLCLLVLRFTTQNRNMTVSNVLKTKTESEHTENRKVNEMLVIPKLDEAKALLLRTHANTNAYI